MIKQLSKAVLLFAFSAVLAFLAGLNVRDVQPVKDWMTVQAEVLAVGRHAEPNRKGGGFQYTPTVRYRYVVEGRAYESENLMRGDGSGAAAWAAWDAASAARAAGKGLSVRVDPRDPASATVGTAPLDWEWKALGVAALLALVSVVMAARAVVRRSRTPETAASSPLPSPKSSRRR